MPVVRIATRKSPLALWQAHYVRDQLQSYHDNLDVELVLIKTKGDKILDTPLAKIGGKGLFVKELEVAMLENEADIAVHSMKDVPMEFPEGLKLQTICPRGNPHDAFVSNHYQSLDELPAGAIVGTSSLRRQSQLHQRRPDLVIKDLRGNVGTRLSKLDAGEFDAIILACAGLERLEIAHRITQQLPADLLLPAGGQGAVGIECRSDDRALHALLAPLEDIDTRDRVLAERAMNRRLQGGCQVPIGCFATLAGDQLELKGFVGSVDGKTLLEETLSGHRDDAEQLGVTLAEKLLARGADRILQDITGASL